MQSEAAAEQERVLAFLVDPLTYACASTGRPPPDRVDRIDTHGSVVFLAGSDAYKVKRAVRFPFMDFSTLEKRRAACEREIAVNRRNAPELYLGVVPVRRNGCGLQLGGEAGEIVEWAVHLARFDENRTFDKLADRGELDLALMAPLAETIVEAHRHAPVADHHTTELLRSRLEDTLDALLAARDIFPPDQAGAMGEALLKLFASIAPGLEAREKAGCVRHCHGDLHLRNIVLHKGRPLLFDAIEFDDSLATCDILYDFAFILMDLWQRGLKAHANRLFNLYLWRSQDAEAMLEGLPALPFFLSLRAAIRARVTAVFCRIETGDCKSRIAEARRFFVAARDFLAERPAFLIAVGGLSGSGKSTFAKTLAPMIGRPPGGLHLRSDVERKKFFNIDMNERLPDEAYREEVTEKIYGRLRDLAAIALRAGHSVLVDAVHAKETERNALAVLAARFEARFAGFWLDAPAESLLARVEARAGDASDARTTVVREQLGLDLGRITWKRLDARRPVEALRAAAAEAIARSAG